jgi:hypothetical protein
VARIAIGEIGFNPAWCCNIGFAGAKARMNLLTAVQFTRTDVGFIDFLH